MPVHDLESAARRALTDTIPLLQQFIAVATISARGELLAEGAEACTRLLRAAGLEVEIWSGTGAPVVYAHRKAPPGAPTILFYGHYDVQPPDPIESWRSPPFEATIRDEAIYGRGSADNKGQLLAHIAAVQTLLATDELDVGVKFLIEGEEEIGSPHLAAVAADHRDELSANIAITADAPVHDDDNLVVMFGVRGLLYVQLDLEGARSDLHSGNRGGLVPAPAWDLVHALASMRKTDGTVTIPGFYDAVRGPSQAEMELLRALPFDRSRLLNELRLECLTPEAEARPWETLMFRPTLNINGLHSGYAGPGAKTIVPGHATCKLDMRLVADQRPEEVMQALQAHLAAQNPDIRVRQLASVPPSSTPLDTPLAQPIIDAVTRASGVRPWLKPRLSGTTPDYVFTTVLGMPSLLIPYGPPDMNHHAPNEKMTFAALQRGIACTMAICEALAP